jgi:uncharacterized protein DUF4159
MMRAALATALLAGGAFPQGPGPPLLGDGSALRIALLDLGAGQSRWHEAAAILYAELRARTSIEPAGDAPVVRIADTTLFRTPLLVLSGTRVFALPSPVELGRLRRFLAYGGLLLVDDTLARPGGPFDRSARAMARALFPDIQPAPVRTTHVLYKSFYLLDGPAGRLLAAPALDAIEQDGRMLVLFSPDDLGSALAQGDERSVRLAVNVVLYALCLDYKDDQVHVPFILRRRHWRAEVQP